jgi:hypothetical protein
MPIQIIYNTKKIQIENETYREITIYFSNGTNQKGYIKDL